MADRDFSSRAEEHRSFSGLLTHAGLSIARMPRHHRVIERLERVDSRDEFLAFLQDADLGLAEPATEWLIDEMTGENWEDCKDTLIRAVDLSRAERYSPSA